MKQLSLIKVGTLALSLQPWKGMPKQSKTPEGYTLKVNGKEVKHPEVMLTGGGTFPQYTYLTVNGEVKWFSGHFESGTALEVVEPTSPAAATATPVPSASATPQKAKKQK